MTLTPVAELAGLPLSGGLAAAVHIAPEGLLLFAPAILSIEPAAAPSPAEETVFAFHGAGEEFALHPPLPQARKLEIPVYRLGAYGVARGSEAERAAQLGRRPASPEDQLLQDVGALAQGERRRLAASGALAEAALTRGAGDYRKQMEARLREYYLEQIDPLLDRAGEDCAVARTLLPGQVTLWKHVLVTIAGAGDTLEHAVRLIETQLAKALLRCYDEAFDKCVGDNDPRRAIEMLAIYEQAGRLGVVGVQTAMDRGKIRRCLRFELEFSSLITFGTPDGGNEHKAFVLVPVGTDESGVGKGKALMNCKYFRWTTGCTYYEMGVEQEQFNVLKLEWPLNAHTRAAGDVDLSRLRLSYHPGNPKAFARGKCGEATVYEPPVGLFLPEYIAAYFQYLRGSEFVATDWLPGQGDLLAEKPQPGGYGGVIIATTKFRLLHRPLD